MSPRIEMTQARRAGKKPQLRALPKHLAYRGRNTANTIGSGEETSTIPRAGDYLIPQEAVQIGRKRVKNKHVETSGTFVFIGKRPSSVDAAPSCENRG